MDEPAYKILAEAIKALPELPQCKHGRALIDWGGEISSLPCKCNWLKAPDAVRKRVAAIKLGLWP